jgi:aminoglycoside phosphotransferase (APT) family kinase protein
LSAQRIGAAVGVASALFLVQRGGYFAGHQPRSTIRARHTPCEWRILKALTHTPVPHPQPVLVCEDARIIGAPFMLMAVIEGFTPGYELPEPLASSDALRHDLAMAYVDACADLASVNWRAGDLQAVGKPDGFLRGRYCAG